MVPGWVQCQINLDLGDISMNWYNLCHTQTDIVYIQILTNMFKLCFFIWSLKLAAREDAKSLWLHLFDFSPKKVVQVALIGGRGGRGDSAMPEKKTLFFAGGVPLPPFNCSHWAFSHQTLLAKNTHQLHLGGNFLLFERPWSDRHGPMDHWTMDHWSMIGSDMLSALGLIVISLAFPPESLLAWELRQDLT